MSRLLRRWGVLEDLRCQAVALEKNVIRRQYTIIISVWSILLTILPKGYENDAEIGTSPFMPQVEEEFGAPLWVIHRADLQMALLKAAKSLGVEVKTGHHVDTVDFGSGEAYATGTRRPRYKVNRGDWLEADVIICADGIKSNTRKEMMKIHGQTDYGTFLQLPDITYLRII